MKKTNLNLDKWQKEFLACKGDKILCKGRQVGASEIASIDAAEYAVKPDNPFPILMTAPTERQAFLLFSKTLDYLMRNYPKMVITRGLKRPTKTKIELKNGMKIYCLPTGQYGVGIRGITVGRSYEDENSRTPEEIESAIAPMLLTTGGKRIKLSTPFGATGEFYNTWINKDGAYDSYTRFSTTTEKVIRERPISKTWTIHQREGAFRLIEQAKARMSDREFQQEFLGEFVEDLHRWFPDKLIEQTCTLKRPNFISKKHNHFGGSDLARMGDDDIAHAIGLRLPNIMHQVEQIVEQKKLTNETEDKIVQLKREYNCKKWYIDAGSGTLGVSIFDHLIIIPDMKKVVVAINNAKRIIEYDREGNAKYVGVHKNDLYMECKALMEQRRVKFLDDDEIKYSLASVQYEYVKKEGQPTKLRIFGVDTHIAESLIRMVRGIKERINKVRISYI